MWWKRKQELDRVEGGYRSKVSTAFSRYLQVRERKLATYLNQKTQGLTRQSKRYFLIGFCLLFGGVSLFQLLKPLFGTAFKRGSYQPASISVPAHIDKTGDDHPYPGQLVTEDDIGKVRAFRLYMDSLKNIPNGKQVYDSLMKARPGLMDTVSLLEQLYYQQKK